VKINNLKQTFFMMIFCLLISCQNNKGTSTGNPVVSLNMTGSSQAALAHSYPQKKSIWDLVMGYAYAFSPPPSNLDSTNLAVSLLEFWISISEIELKYDEFSQPGEVNGNGVNFAGPYVVNLFSNSPSSVAALQVSQSSLRRLKYKTKNIFDLASGAPAGMLNSGIYLQGVVGGNNFIFQSKEQLVFEMAGPNLVTLSSGDHLLLQLQTANLIRKINLSTVLNNTTISESNRVLMTNPCPLIDPSAADIYTCFIKGLSAQTKVGKDDGDFIFGVGEPTIN